MIVSSRNDDAATLDKRSCPRLEERSEFVVEGFVDFVQEKDLRIGFFGNGKPKPRFHALGVGQDRALERIVEAASSLDVIHGLQDYTARKSRDDAEKECILATGQQAQQTRIDREKRRDPSLNHELAAIGRQNTRKNAKKRCLTGSASTDQCRSLRAKHGESDLLEAPVSRPAAPQSGLDRSGDA